MNATEAEELYEPEFTHQAHSSGIIVGFIFNNNKNNNDRGKTSSGLGHTYHFVLHLKTDTDTDYWATKLIQILTVPLCYILLY